MTHYLAWPVAVFFIVVLLRHPIKAMFARIKQARFKTGNTEATFDLMEKTLEAIAEEKPGVIPLSEVTEENLNLATFTNLASRYQAVLALLLLNDDVVITDADFLRKSLHSFEEASSLLKAHMPADQLEDVQRLFDVAWRRLAPNLDNPS